MESQNLRIGQDLGDHLVKTTHFTAETKAKRISQPISYLNSEENSHLCIPRPAHLCIPRPAVYLLSPMSSQNSFLATPSFDHKDSYSENFVS